MLYPAPDGDMVHRNSALGHHLFQVAVAQRIPQVPPHVQNDDDIVKVSPSEQRWSGPAHRLTIPEDPKPFATDPTNPFFGVKSWNLLCIVVEHAYRNR